jgi:hypothetical protein
MQALWHGNHGKRRPAINEWRREMANDKCQMTNEAQLPNAENDTRFWTSDFGILSSFGIRHSSFEFGIQ